MADKIDNKQISILLQKLLDEINGGVTLSENLAKVGGNTVIVGNGVTGTGSQRETIASDNTPFAIKTDQTTHGTTDLVAADITKVAGSTISQGHGTAASAIRVELPTDGTGVVGLTAGEAHIGAIGGNTTFVSSTITMSAAGVYATGDYMGTTTSPQSFTNAVRTSGGTGIIKTIVISDKITTTNVAMELWFFSATFVAPTDNAAWAISDAEALTVLGVVPIDATKWYASSNNTIYVDDTVNIVIKPAATSLFYALVARGTTPSFTSGDLTINLGILQD